MYSLHVVSPAVPAAKLLVVAQPQAREIHFIPGGVTQSESAAQTCVCFNTEMKTHWYTYISRTVLQIQNSNSNSNNFIIPQEIHNYVVHNIKN